MNFHQSRIKAFLQLLPSEQVDAFLVSNPTNLNYFLGLSSQDGQLMISAKKCVYFTSSEGEITRPSLDAVEVYDVPSKNEIVPALAKQLSSLGVKALGVEGDHLTWTQATALIEQLPKIAVQPVKTTIERLRALKDPGEVEFIRSANDLAGRAWRMMSVMLTEGDTEAQLGQLVEQYIRRIGGRLATTDEPVRLGLNTGTRGNEQESVSEVSKLLFDVTVSNGYNARLVRSMKTPFAVSPSRKNKRERLAYNYDNVMAATVAAQTAAVAQMKEGATAGEVFAACRESLEKSGFAAALDPVLGHGIGLQPVEYPVVRAGSGEVLKSGMVINLTPRLSFPDWGGVAIGDAYVIRGNQAIRLSSTPREPASHSQL